MTRREAIDAAWADSYSSNKGGQNVSDRLREQGRFEPLTEAIGDTQHDLLSFAVARAFAEAGLPICRTTIEAALLGAMVLHRNPTRAGLMALLLDENEDPHPDLVETLVRISEKKIRFMDRSTGQVSDEWPSSEAQIALDALEDLYPKGSPNG